MNTKSIDTNQIKRLVDCRDIAARYSELRKQSLTESAGPCPFCGGTDRFRVFADHWFCRPDGIGHCGRKGDTIALVMLRENVDFRRACELLSGGVLPTTSVPAKPVKPAPKLNPWNEDKQLQKAVAAHKALLSGAGKYAELSREYLTSRGITVATVEAFKLGYRAVDLPGSADYDTNRHSYPKQMAILIPWFDRNSSLVAIKYRFLEAHEYVDLSGEQRKESKTSRGNFAGALFGWQAVKGPETNKVLIITEGEINALSLWQAGNGLVDVLSPGTESMLENLSDSVTDYARQYQHRIVWADKGNIADSAALAIGAASMRSPSGQDANDLLKAGKLEKLLGAMLKKIGATVEAPSPSAQPIEDEPADYAYDEPEVIQAGLSWAEAERLHAELKVRVSGQMVYGIGADPAQPGMYRIVQREDY